MGVDSYIFDEVSKECFNFDRRYNLKTGIDDPLAEEIWNKIYNIDAGRATAGEVAYLCDANVVYFQTSPEVEEDERQRRVWWNEAIKRFVLARPDGSFFTQSDHDSPESWEVKRVGRYREIAEP